jgi:heme exporter protein CcmD
MGETAGDNSMSFLEFIQMGGYAVFVWSAYIIATVLLIANLWLPKRRHRKQLIALTKQDQQTASKQNDPAA